MSSYTYDVARTNGVAGQFQLTAKLDDAHGGPITFVGSSYGGPIVMVTAAYPDGVRVSDPDRFGGEGLTPAWVRAFCGTLDVMAERN